MTRKWTLFYVLTSIVWTVINFNIGGGEEGIVFLLTTTLLTFPIGLLLWSVGHLLPSGLLVPIMLLLNYFQWHLLIKGYQKIKPNKN